MLYEIHDTLANELDKTLDMGGARRLLDLDSGSRVVALALAGHEQPSW
jgi:hypothetical protein